MTLEHRPASSQAFIKIALERILSALVKTVAHFGITYPELVGWLKRAYVLEVQKELVKQGENVTVSRISVSSGIHRKDVKRLLEEGQVKPSTERSSLTARLISLWVGDSRYLDKDGLPKQLPRNGDNSFESLVQSVSTDVRSRAVLDDLVKRGIVLVEAEQLQLNQQALFPSDDLETKIEFLARNVSDHISTCHRNLQGVEPPLPERSVFYDRLSQTSVDSLQQLATQKMTQLILDVNQSAQSLSERDDQNPEGNHHRFILGSYFYREQEGTKHDS